MSKVTHGQRRRGQALVELCLILPLTLVIVSAIAEFTWIFWNSVALNNACHAGARVGVIEGNSDTTVVATTMGSMAGIPLTTVQIQVFTPEGNEVLGSNVRIVGHVLRVSGTCRYDFLTPLPYLVPGVAEKLGTLQGRANLVIESASAGS